MGKLHTVSATLSPSSVPSSVLNTQRTTTPHLALDESESLPPPRLLTALKQHLQAQAHAHERLARLRVVGVCMTEVEVGCVDNTNRQQDNLMREAATHVQPECEHGNPGTPAGKKRLAAACLEQHAFSCCLQPTA